MPQPPVSAEPTSEGRTISAFIEGIAVEIALAAGGGITVTSRTMPELRVFGTDWADVVTAAAATIRAARERG